MWLMVAILGNTGTSIFITHESSIGRCYSRGNYSSPILSPHALVELTLPTALWVNMWHRTPVMILRVTQVIIQTNVGSFTYMTTKGILFSIDGNLSVE